MSIPSDILNQLFSLPADDRYLLAQRLLDSINDTEAVQFDEAFVAELRRRREEMLRGEAIVADWHVALSEIDQSLST
jgi:putative addiction module component (TIGR02574 family)